MGDTCTSAIAKSKGVTASRSDDILIQLEGGPMKFSVEAEIKDWVSLCTRNRRRETRN